MSTLKPVYLLAGGRPRNPASFNPLFQQVFKESSVKTPKIAYLGCASDDNQPFYLMMAAALKGAGAGKVTMAKTTSPKADINKTKDILAASDIIYISGGDVEQGMRVAREKNLAEYLTELYQLGKPFFGISAGTIMLAKEWIRWRNPDDDTTAEIFPCLGMANLICDTHGEADNWVELQALLALEPDNTMGYGIISGAALKVTSDGKIEALGGAVNQYKKVNGKVVRVEDILPVDG